MKKGTCASLLHKCTQRNSMIIFSLILASTLLGIFSINFEKHSFFLDLGNAQKHVPVEIF